MLFESCQSRAAVCCCSRTHRVLGPATQVCSTQAHRSWPHFAGKQEVQSTWMQATWHCWPGLP